MVQYVLDVEIEDDGSCFSNQIDGVLGDMIVFMEYKKQCQEKIKSFKKQKRKGNKGKRGVF